MKKQLKENLYWEKFRPNTIEKEKGKIPIILLPRVKKLFEQPIEFNIMLTGDGGLGKSSLINIISQNFNTLKINCSKKSERGIDVIDSEVDSHIRNYGLPFKKKNIIGDGRGPTAIWLEEFDNSTPDLRKALRAYIEDESDVRFFATVNNITKLQRTKEDRALISRFNVINFEPQNKDEVVFLKEKQKNYLESINKLLKKDMDGEVIDKLINRTFPNFRSTIQLLQEIHITGDFDTYLKETNVNQDVYSFILNNENKANENFFYVSDNYPREKTEDLLNILSRPFFKYLIENHIDMIMKIGFKIMKLSKEYNAQYLQTIDPEMHLSDYISNLKAVINEYYQSN